MPKPANPAKSLPPVVHSALRQMGENLAIARNRRRETQKQWAQRLGVSVPTLIRLEKGDAGVSLAVVATALWLIGKPQALADITAPSEDTGALEQDIRRAQQHGAPRRRAGPGRESH